MIYASTPPRNTDPYPYYCIYGPSCRHSQKLSPSTTHAPRPKFQARRTHEANPILVEFRRSSPFHLSASAYLEAEWLANPAHPLPVTATPDQVDHARRVLTRLANFTEVAS